MAVFFFLYDILILCYIPVQFTIIGFLYFQTGSIELFMIYFIVLIIRSGIIANKIQDRQGLNLYQFTHTSSLKVEPSGIKKIEFVTKYAGRG